jgi:predicted AlkP superfamily pyrophosphatase or phosphodiesterase
MKSELLTENEQQNEDGNEEEEEEDDEWDDERRPRCYGGVINKKYRHLFLGLCGGATVFLLFTVLIATIVIPSIVNGNIPSRHVVILISLDGFPYSYLFNTAFSHPNLDLLTQTGVSAPLVPVFPSKTFPNHYSIVTGLYSESHGIIDNRFYDPIMNLTFDPSQPSSLNPSFWGGEPLWVTVQKNNLKSATMFWPGSEVNFSGMMPTYWFPYNSSLSDSDRFNQVLQWLSMSDESRPSFITLYISTVDTYGHQYGPNSLLMIDVVKQVDDLLGTLIAAIEQVTFPVDLVILSDHGMTQISDQNVIFLDDYIDLSNLTIVTWSPITQIWPQSNDTLDLIVTQLANVSHITVYKREDIPDSFHYRNNFRVAPLIVLADEGWSITTRVNFTSTYWTYNGGSHGYNPSFADMHGIFVANGDSFQVAVQRDSISAVEIYNLVATALQLKSTAPNNGTSPALPGFLKGM